MKHRSLGVAALVFALAFPAAGFTQEAAKTADNPTKFERSDNLQSNLARHVGQRVELVLTSGQHLTGTVKEVGAHVIHLAGLEGKEFFDALVLMDQIQAVILRVKQG